MAEQLYKQCLHCKRMFWCINKDFYKTTDYCSTSCELSSGHSFIVVCGYCGGTIITRDKRIKFCDAQCRQSKQLGRTFIQLDSYEYTPKVTHDIDNDII